MRTAQKPARPSPARPLTLAAAFAVAASLLLASCGEAPQTPSAKSDAAEALQADSEVVARVNGKPIYKADVLAEAVLRRWITVSDDLDPTSSQFGKIVDDLVERALFAQEAETQKLDQDPDVKRRLEVAREMVLDQALRAKIAAEMSGEDDIQRFYRERVSQIPLGQKVRARLITTATREDAEAAKRQLARGESFAAVAFERSQDAQTRAEGGDLGEFLPERLADGLRQAAETTPVGQIAGPIQTPRGWHLLKVESRRQEEAPSLEQLRPELQRWLVFNAMNELFDRLSSAANIERVSEDTGVDLPSDPAAGPAEENTEEPPPRPAGPVAGTMPMGPGALAGSAGQDLVRAAPAGPTAPKRVPPPATAPVPSAPAPAPTPTPAAAPKTTSAAPQNGPIVITPRQPAASPAAATSTPPPAKGGVTVISPRPAPAKSDAPIAQKGEPGQ